MTSEATGEGLTGIDRRAALFDALHEGRLAPAEAERLAREQGLSPLRKEPAAGEFDPEKEDWWTLPMALAWIVWRTIDRVRDQYDPYRRATPYWYFQEMKLSALDGLTRVEQCRWFLKDRGEASAMDLALVEAFNLTQDEREPTMTTVREAREQFWQWAGSGACEIAAVRMSDQEVVAIPEREWSYVELHQRRGRDELCFSHDKLVPRYHTLRVRRLSVFKRWPKSQLSARAKRNAKKRFADWLAAAMVSSRDNPTMTKAGAAEIAKKVFGIGRDDFRSIWADAIIAADAPAWSRPGPRHRDAAEKIGRAK